MIDAALTFSCDLSPDRTNKGETMELIRERLSYANVIATLALFAALGLGTAYAADKIGSKDIAKNAIKSKHIKAGNVKNADLAPGAVDSAKVADSSLLTKDFAAGQLPRGPQGDQGPRGQMGDACLPSTPACVGPPGTAAVSEFAQFFALAPPDNAATVAPGAAVDFPQNGPTQGGIARTSPDAFVLADVGTYRVGFIVSVSEAGQLALNLDGNELGYTVFGRATGASQIVGEALVTTTGSNSTLSVVNPTGNSTALTITPLAGGTHPVATSLVIQRLR
jgi:hypothetical protein